MDQVEECRIVEDGQSGANSCIAIKVMTLKWKPALQNGKAQLEYDLQRAACIQNEASYGRWSVLYNGLYCIFKEEPKRSRPNPDIVTENSSVMYHCHHM